MFNKKHIIVLILLIIGIVCISTVSANGLSENVINDTNSYEIAIEDMNNIDEENIEMDTLKSSADDILGSSAGTFTELQNKIKGASEGSTITLNKDYTYNTNFGSSDGVVISKSLTINGNGHVIDGLSKSRLLLISGANNVVLKNIVFKNGASFDGGAVISQEVGKSTFVKCSFINNFATYGGAVLINDNDYSSFDSCTFNGNFADVAGGAIYSTYVTSSSVNECSFDKNYVNSNGGAIFSINDNHFTIDSSIFNNNDAYTCGGAIYLDNVVDCKLNLAKFYNNIATYGGVIFGDKSSIDIKNSDMYNSLSYSFGGAIASNSTDLTVNNCNFKNSTSMYDAGGAIYNFKGNINVIKSSFVDGTSQFGGAITNLQSDLTVLSSEFINNNAESFGGAIYHIYGAIKVNDSTFKNSHADIGGAINCMISPSVTFKNNIFLNSTANVGSAIYRLYSKNIVESANHFEDVYKVYVEYKVTQKGTFKMKSKVLSYIVSNDGKFLNTYENMDSTGDTHQYIRLKFWDSDYPNNSAIYGNYGNTFTSKYDFSKDAYVEPGYLETLYVYVCDIAGNILNNTEIEGVDLSLQMNGEVKLNFDERRIVNFNHLNNYNSGSYYYPISLINSSCSDLTVIPSSYDSRDYDYVTPVRNQGNAGNCWAFAGIATLETCFKKITGYNVDFSEKNAKNLMAMYSAVGINKDTNKGGYEFMLMSYLNSWMGPVSEWGETYDELSVVSSFYYPLLNIQNIYFLPARENSLDNDAYKKAIMDYGAVSVGIAWSKTVNHAICLVGWDDNYNGKDSLGTSTKGAWIFKNSWGENWGDNGYGYLSYKTDFLSDSSKSCQAYTFIFNKNDAYVYNYQYDDSGLSDYLTNEGHIFYSNKFKSRNIEDLEYLSAFATYFKYPTNYKVSVYLNGKAVLTQSGYSEAGYYTIPFNKKIALSENDEFEIRIENCNNGNNYAPICQADELNMVNFEAGNSFVSFDGKTWTDLYNLEGYHEFLYGGVKKNTCQVACIKAFTSLYDSLNDLYDSVYSVDIDVNKFDSLELNEEITVKMTLKENKYFSVVSELLNNTLVSININGKDYYGIISDGMAYIYVSLNKAGNYKLTAQLKNNLFTSNVVQFNFKINKANAVISNGDVSKVYGGSEKSVVTLKDSDGNVIKDAVITFNINGQTTNVKTDSKGQASMALGLDPNTYVATVSFKGNDNYLSSSKTVKIIVKKATPKITASKNTFKANVKTKKYTATLKDNNGKAMKNLQLKIKVNGKTYSAKTNSKGQATFKITKLTKKGSHQATITFAGNKYYNKATKKVTITVKK